MTPGGQRIIHRVKWKDNQGQEHVEDRDYIEQNRMVSLLEPPSQSWAKVEVVFTVGNKGTVYQGYVDPGSLASIDKYPA